MSYPFDKPSYKLTCEDFDYTGVSCCDTCHDPDLAEYSLRRVKVDGVKALLCCCLVAFFYPRDPSEGLSPEERLLRAIFKEKAVHPIAEQYLDPDMLRPEEDD